MNNICHRTHYSILQRRTYTSNRMMYKVYKNEKKDDARLSGELLSPDDSLMTSLTSRGQLCSAIEFFNKAVSKIHLISWCYFRSVKESDAMNKISPRSMGTIVDLISDNLNDAKVMDFWLSLHRLKFFVIICTCG